MRKFIDKLQARQQELAEKEDGFSLLELVVAVSIMLILAVVGFIAYQGLTDNARDAAVDSAANQVLTAAIAADNSPGADQTIAGVVEDYSGSSDGIDINVTGDTDGLTVTAWDDNGHWSQMTAPGDYSHEGTDAGDEIPTGLTDTPSGD